jgi:GTP-binding protein HflX
MRAERERAHLPTVALAGYTNAGKSTLLNKLTDSEVGVRNRLFHTLDPTTRSFEIGGRDYLLTDTVGFIRKLPHELVEAFAGTLEEALTADLIVHVADASQPEEELAERIAAVDEVLAEIGAAERPRLLALNKIDMTDDDRRHALSFRYPRAVQVSAVTGEGLDDLHSAIEGQFLSTLRPMRLLVPYAEGGSLSELHELAGELDREDTPRGALIRARVPAGVARRFERFELNGDGDGDGSAPNGAAPDDSD